MDLFSLLLVKRKNTFWTPIVRLPHRFAWSRPPGSVVPRQVRQIHRGRAPGSVASRGHVVGPAGGLRGGAWSHGGVELGGKELNEEDSSAKRP